MVAEAESMLDRAKDAALPLRYLVRDQDVKHTKRFDAVFEDAGVAIEPTAPRAPTQNAVVERWVGSIKHECLNRFIAFGRGHFDYVASEYLSCCHELRPHQRKENRPLLGVWPELDDPPDEIVCRAWLGGVLKHDERRAT